MYINIPRRNPNNKKKYGFTIVEMMIIAPIVILVIGVVISAIINMTGAVLASRGSNALAFDIQQALSQIDQDVSASSGYLAVNNVSLTSPQGYNNDTTNFENSDATMGTALILNTYATTTNPISSTRSYVYATGQPYACASSLVNQNAKITMNIIYFVKNNSLWRRVVAPSNYNTAGCSVPWQQPTCSPGYVDPFCKTNDEDLVDGVQASGFKVNYFVSGSSTANAMASDNTQSNTMRQAAMNPTNTVTVEIDAAATLAGRNISQAGTIRSINSNTTYVNSAPLSPVADWIATPQGDHVGNFYDLVTKQYATVTRASAKTIYDPATQKIYDVPVNYLGVNPRSDGKSGSEAVIEEARTNYLLNSYGASNNGSAWSGFYLSNRTPTYSLVQGVYSSNAQRVQYTGTAGDSSAELIFVTAPTAVGSFGAGDAVTVSAYIKGSLSGADQLHFDIQAKAADGSYLGEADSSAFAVTSSFTRFTLTYSSLPANTSMVQFMPYITGVNSGDIIDLTFDALQLEKGAFTTSYIPTTTTTVTRSADVVTVPTTGWNASAGTIAAVAQHNSNITTGNDILHWFNGTTGYQVYLHGWANHDLIVVADSSGSIDTGYGMDVGSSQGVVVGTYSASALSAYWNGTLGGSNSSGRSPTGLPSTALIGSINGSTNFIDAPIQRLTIYNSALSSSNVSTVTSAIQNGP